MSLTREELLTLDAAKLEALVARIQAAVARKDQNNFDRASSALTDFIARTPFDTLQTKARNAQSAAAGFLSTGALDDLAKISEHAAAAGAGFKAAAMIADTGKEELLFPALAATAAHGLELLNQFKEAIDKVKSTIGNVADLGSVPSALDDVLQALGGLKNAIERTPRGDGN